MEKEKIEQLIELLITRILSKKREAFLKHKKIDLTTEIVVYCRLKKMQNDNLES